MLRRIRWAHYSSKLHSTWHFNLVTWKWLNYSLSRGLIWRLRHIAEGHLYMWLLRLVSLRLFVCCCKQAPTRKLDDIALRFQWKNMFFSASFFSTCSVFLCFYLSCVVLLLINSDTLQIPNLNNSHRYQELQCLKEVTFSQPPFWVYMSVFGGVNVWWSFGLLFQPFNISGTLEPGMKKSPEKQPLPCFQGLFQ